MESSTFIDKKGFNSPQGFTATVMAHNIASPESIIYGNNFRNRKNEEFLSPFPILSCKWKEIYETLTKGKNKKEDILRKFIQIYPEFLMLVKELEKELTKEVAQIRFPDKFLYTVILAIDHNFSKQKDDLPIFRKFLFTGVQFRYITAMTKQHIEKIEKILKEFFKSLKLNNTDTHFLKQRLYDMFLILFSISQLEDIKEVRFDDILKHFNEAFALIKPSIGNIEDIDWRLQGNNKLSLISFNRSYLSLYLVEGKCGLERVKVSLRHVALKCAYKIVKRGIRSLKYNGYNELLTTLGKNALKHGEYVIKPGVSNIDAILFINESITIIKLHIFKLVHFDGKVSGEKSTSTYDIIQKLTNNCISLGINCELFNPIRTKKDLESSIINSNALYFVFKALLKFTSKDLSRNKEKVTLCLNGITNLCFTAMQSIAKEEHKLFFRFYLLTFISNLRVDILTGVMKGMHNEIETILREADKESKSSLLYTLRSNCFECALEIYLQVSLANYKSCIKNTLEHIQVFISEEKEDLVLRSFYVLMSLLLKRKITGEDYTKLTRSNLSESNIKKSDPIMYFLNKKLFGSLLELYMKIIEKPIAGLISDFILRFASLPQVNHYLLKQYLNVNTFLDYRKILPYRKGQSFIDSLFRVITENLLCVPGNEEDALQLSSLLIYVLDQLIKNSLNTIFERRVFFSLVFTLETLVSNGQVRV